METKEVRIKTLCVSLYPSQIEALERLAATFPQDKRGRRSLALQRLIDLMADRALAEMTPTPEVA